MMYGGHLPAEPNATALSSNAVTAHLYFFMVKNRKTADIDRVVFWFNVCSSSFIRAFLFLFNLFDLVHREVQDVLHLTVP